jgi:hypothetical protein
MIKEKEDGDHEEQDEHYVEEMYGGCKNVVV